MQDNTPHKSILPCFFANKLDFQKNPCNHGYDFHKPVHIFSRHITFNMTMQQQNTTIKRTFTGCGAPQPQCGEHGRGSCSGFFRFAAAPRGLFLRAAREAHGG